MVQKYYDCVFPNGEKDINSPFLLPKDPSMDSWKWEECRDACKRKNGTDGLDICVGYSTHTDGQCLLKSQQCTNTMLTESVGYNNKIWKYSNLDLDETACKFIAQKGMCAEPRMKIECPKECREPAKKDCHGNDMGNILYKTQKLPKKK